MVQLRTKERGDPGSLKKKHRFPSHAPPHPDNCFWNFRVCTVHSWIFLWIGKSSGLHLQVSSLLISCPSYTLTYKCKKKVWKRGAAILKSSIVSLHSNMKTQTITHSVLHISCFERGGEGTLFCWSGLGISTCRYLFNLHRSLTA